MPDALHSRVGDHGNTNVGCIYLEVGAALLSPGSELLSAQRWAYSCVKRGSAALERGGKIAQTHLLVVPLYPQSRAGAGGAPLAEAVQQ